MIHIGDFGHVPRRDVLIEGRGIAEHVGHGGDVGHVPRRDVFIECVLRHEY